MRSVAGALVTVLLVANPAVAAERSYFIAPSVMVPLNGASVGADKVILPSSGVPSFFFTLHLPLDHKPDTAVKFKVLFRQVGVACAIKFSVVEVLRYRLGKPVISGPAGMSAVNGLTSTIAANVVTGKTFKINPLASGTIKGLRSGDILKPVIARDPGSSEDTCATDLLVDGVEVIYRKR